MRRVGVVSVIVALCVGTPVVAQTTGRITGTVTAVDGGQPLASVQVRVAGTQLGAITREDGRYTIVAPAGTYTVVAARIGLVPDSATGVAVTASGSATANFSLRSATLVLQSVVTIGYGTQEARDNTGSAVAVTPKEFNPGRIISPEELIKAKVPGVQVVDNNEPGGGVAVRIRGGTSINASNDPLYVIDGVPLAVGGGVSAGRNPLNFLNPNDIASVSVLKDASATAIYGSRGANGVVLITTRSGAQGTQVTLNSTVSSSQLAGTPSLLNAAQFRAAVQQYAPENVNQLGSSSTDFYDAITRNATGQDHTLGIAGAREDMRYRVSLGYLDQDGIVRGTTSKRASLSLNYTDDVFDDALSVQANVKGSRADDRFTPGAVIGSATSFAPTQSIYNANGAYYQYSNILAPTNPLSDLALISDAGKTYRSVGNAEVKYSAPWVEGLSATVRGGYDVTRAERTTFTPSTQRNQAVSSFPGTFYRRTPNETHTVLDAFGNYTKSLASYNTVVDVTAGYSYEDFNSDEQIANAQGLSSNLLGSSGIPTASQSTNTLDVQESRLISGFARANLTYNDKYLLTVSVRRDGSSRFGEGNQWGVFPSAALAWRVSNEGFMKRFSSISDLKARVSYGVNGNQSFGNYRQYSTYAYGDNKTQVQFGNSFVTVIRPTAVDPNIKWEETRSVDAGLDFGLFDNRITGSFDYYHKKTTDLIFTVPVAAGTNLSNFVTTNIGSLQNRGVEFGINARVIDGPRGGFTYDAGLNASANRSKLLKINSASGASDQILVGGIAGGVGSNIQVLQPGYAINSFFVYQHKLDANGKPVYADANGDKTINEQDLYVDLNGDKTINQSDRRAYKSPQPKVIFGHTSNFGYRNFDAGFTLRAYVGNYVYNNVASNLGHYSAVRGGFPVNLESSVLETGFVEPQYFSDYYIEDASFLRMDNVTLGYTFRRKSGLDRVRIYGTVQNVFTATKYSGVDPSAGLNGIDNNLYPLSRIFVTGFNINF